MYDTNGLLNCHKVCEKGFPFCYTEDQISEILNIYTLDKVIILILAPISLISSIFVIYTFLKYKECRQQPGDLILAISISEFILIIHWVSMVVYDIINGQGPLSDSGFCQTESAFSIMAGTSEFVYNCLFCLFIVFSIRNSLFKTKIPKKSLHLVAALVIIGVYVFCLLTKSTGLSLFGMCSFRQKSNFGLLGVIIVCIYLILSTLTIIYFKKKVPNNDHFKEYRKEFLGYYYSYVIMQSIIWFVLAISNLFAGLNCTDFQQPGLNFFITIGNTSKLATSVCLSIIRYKDPNIKKQIRPILEKKFPCLIKPESENQISFIQSEIQDLDSQRNSDNKPTIKTQKTGNFYNNLTDAIRISQIYTMISGIVASQKLSHQKQSLSLKEITRSDCTDKFEIVLTQDKINGIQSLKVPSSHKVTVNKTKMIYYAPRTFKTFVEIDRRMVNLDLSFNIKDNINDIETQFGGGDGGRSGSFFYMTNDKKMIMKSMTSQEKDIMFQKLLEYTTHMSQNEDSMISKIYGLYTFQFEDKTEHILIMRNIQSCPSKYKIRTYDLKGSTVDRQVIQSNLPQEEKLAIAAKSTLKDTDFQELEKNGKVNIDPEIAKQISEILTKDAELFKNMGVMDYSLLIFKVNWTLYGIENEVDENQAISERFNNKLCCIQSTLEPGIYYHMAIIDYLQVWNPQKVFEKNFKQLKQLNTTVDISAKPPPEYCARFIKNIAQQLFQEEY